MKRRCSIVDDFISGNTWGPKRTRGENICNGISKLLIFFIDSFLVPKSFERFGWVQALYAGVGRVLCGLGSLLLGDSVGWHGRGAEKARAGR